MPRRKRHFIDRSRAKTFQLVNAPTEANPSHHVFMPLTAGSQEQQLGLQEKSQLGTDDAVQIPSEEDYNKRDYELGEFGFPDDGYDYSQHFRPIGGGGGVFMDAVTGLPNPDAVSSIRRRRKNAILSERNPDLRLRDPSELRDQSAQNPESEEKPEESWLNPEDAHHRMRAIEEIRRDRKNNRDLDEVFAYLDSDGELDSTPSEAHDIDSNPLPDNIFADSHSETNSALLEDDFIAMANALPSDGHHGESNQSNLWNNIREPYRKPRDLDEQFEKFMNGFQLDSTDEEYEEIEEQLKEQADRQGDDNHPLNYEPSGDFWEENDLVEGLAALNCNDKTIEDSENHQLGPDVSETGAGPSCGRDKEFEQFAAAEFENGMERLLGSYVRAGPKEALEAFDGVDKAREAIRQSELEEKEYIKKLNDLNIESDGHDSELDSQFEEMYKQEEKWDCETILTTYTNLENHPSVIDAPSGRRRVRVQRAAIIQLDPRTQAPAEFGEGDWPTASASSVDYGTRRAAPNVSSRTRGESKEEKKARKTAAKEASRERRALKSEMKRAFGAEKTKQGRHATAIGKAKVAVKL
ncbi:Low temperature viability protein [Gracilaria domingensis]|nr:Low temperature viability protein [Gracilaria domingensis]